MVRLQSKFLRLGLLAVLFVASVAATLFAIRKWRQGRTPPAVTSEGSLANIPGLIAGQTVKLPTLSTLENKPIDLAARGPNYLLLAFFSTKCEGCAIDEPFWRDLRNEISGQRIDFYVVSIDDEQSSVQKYASTYSFTDLPVLFDPQRTAVGIFRIQFVPQYMLFTTNGKVIRRWTGIRNYERGRGPAVDRLPNFPELVPGDSSAS